MEQSDRPVHAAEPGGEKAAPRAGRQFRARMFVIYLCLLALCVPVGTFWHEVVGHGLVGTLCGGQITYVEVLGVELYPEPDWIGWQGHYGWCGVDGVSSATGESITWLAGSLSTWLVAAVATVVLYLRRWRGLPRAILVSASLWWIDLATYLLPVAGFRRSLFWGGYYSEPYEAAVALGIPGAVFLTLALGSSALLAVALTWRFMMDRPMSKANSAARHGLRQAGRGGAQTWAG